MNARSCWALLVCAAVMMGCCVRGGTARTNRAVALPQLLAPGVSPGRYEAMMRDSAAGLRLREILAIAQDGTWWCIQRQDKDRRYKATHIWGGHVTSDDGRILLHRTMTYRGDASHLQIRSEHHVTSPLDVRDSRTLWNPRMRLEYRWVGPSAGFRGSMQQEFEAMQHREWEAGK
jgi:hypothetical protein